MEILSYLGASHWLALGLTLLIAEALGAAGFLIGAAVAAFAMAAVAWLVPDLSVTFQLALYALAAVVATWVYLQMFRGITADDAGDFLNRRSDQLVGTTLTLTSSIGAHEEVRVQVGDTLWRVHANQAMHAGDKVRIIASDEDDAMRLEVGPIDEYVRG